MIFSSIYIINIKYYIFLSFLQKCSATLSISKTTNKIPSFPTSRVLSTLRSKFICGQGTSSPPMTIASTISCSSLISNPTYRGSRRDWTNSMRKTNMRSRRSCSRKRAYPTSPRILKVRLRTPAF